MATVIKYPQAVVSETDEPLGLRSAGLLMTPEEFDAIEEFDEEYDYELIHGVLVVHAIPSYAEVSPNEFLGYLLLAYQEHHPQGKALDATYAERYVYTEGSRRKADRVIWAGLGRPPRPRTDPPTIVVEFVSSGRRNHRRDYEEKRREYLAAAVREYWVIDRFTRKLTVFREPTSGSAEQTIAEQDTYRTPLLPGFELPLSVMMAKADEGTALNES